jgi:hypothetical protein
MAVRHVAIFSALIGAAALAAPSQASTLDFGFSSRTPTTGTAMTLHVRYTKTGADASAKPSPIRHFQLDAPAGTVFHTARVPACGADDAQVRLRGPGACPPSSQVGDGVVTVVTGFGPPFDPFGSPTAVFNDGKGWLEISQTPTTPAATIAVTRLTVTGSRVSGPIGASPGGPPDFETAVSKVDFTFPVSSGYITTPPACPASGLWVATGTFAFADGTTQVVTGTTPCEAGGKPAPRPPAIHAALTPRRVRAGRSTRVSVRLASSDARCVAHATVRLPGYGRVRTDAAGRATIVKTFRVSGRRLLVASVPGCAKGRAALTVLPRGEHDADS